MAVFHEKRVAERARIQGKIMYSRMRGGEYYNARLFDCTNDGIGFISEYPYLRDTRIFLRSKNKGDTLRQPAVVRWSMLNPGSDKKHPSYRVGARFVSQ